MNKKFLLKIMMILSLVIAISCKSNSNPDENNKTEQNTITIKKADIVQAIKDKGVVGTTGQNKSGQYDFSIIKDIKEGGTDPATITGTGATGNTSKKETADLMKKTFEESEFTVEGVDIQANVSNFDKASENTAVDLILTLTPLPETKDKKYVFDADLTSALKDSKLIIKIAPTSGANWK